MSNKNTFGRREPLLHPRDYGKDNEFRRPNGNAVFAQNEVTGSPTIAFVYRRKKERRRTDPLPEIWSGFDSPYKTKEKGSGRKRRPKSAKSAKSRRSNRGSGVPSPYATPRRTLDYNGSIASSRRSSRPSTAPNERRARKSKFDIPKGRAETKDEAVIRRRKAALSALSEVSASQPPSACPSRYNPTPKQNLVSHFSLVKWSILTVTTTLQTT